MLHSDLLTNITTYYFTSRVWFILTMLSLVYIFISMNREDKKKLIIVAILFIVAILNEVSFTILTKLFDPASYYRFLWSIPYLIIVAIAFSKLIFDIYSSGKLNYVAKALIIIVLAVAILLGLYKLQPNYVQLLVNNIPQNKYQVSDDTLNIKYIIDTERNQGNIDKPTIACDKSTMIEYQTIDADSIVSTSRYIYLHIRDYKADISMMPQSIQDKYLLTTICEDNEQPDIMQAKAAIIREQIDYIVVHHYDGAETYMETLDCSLVGSTGNYYVYRVNNNNYDTVMNQADVDRISRDIGLKIRDINISLSARDDLDNNNEVIASYLVLNDLHSFLTTDDTSKNYYPTIDQRYDMFVTSETRMHSQDTWQSISAIIDSFEAEGLLMAGDMVDFASSTNYQLFQLGLNKIKTPIMYARADHDTSAWYNDEGRYTNDDAKEAQTSLASENMTKYEDLMVWDKEDYYIMAWNNSTSQLTEVGLKQAKKIFEKDKPIILLTHVPINSTINAGLYNASKAYDDKNRAKLWGDNCLYVPNDVTGEFIDMVVSDDSPVVAVVSGHLHFRYDTKLNSHCVEYVLDPSFAGNMARINIVR